MIYVIPTEAPFHKNQSILNFEQSCDSHDYQNSYCSMVNFNYCISNSSKWDNRFGKELNEAFDKYSMP